MSGTREAHCVLGRDILVSQHDNAVMATELFTAGAVLFGVAEVTSLN